MLDAIRRMGVLQIDTISVVARSPYLVLWSRLGVPDDPKSQPFDDHAPLAAIRLAITAGQRESR